MSHMIQLNPSIPVLTPFGGGETVGWIQESKEDHLIWIVILDDNGQVWQFPNPLIRGYPVMTNGRMVGKKTKDIIKELQDANPDWIKGKPTIS